MAAQALTGSAYSIAVTGMSCAACVRHVEKALAAVAGVRSVSVNLAAERADLTIDDPAALARLPDVLDSAGYGIPVEEVEFTLDGLSCAACVKRAEQAIAAVPGVTGVAVNLATARASLTRYTGLGEDAAVIVALADAGFDAAPVVSTDARAQQGERRQHEITEVKRAALLAGLLTLPVFVAEMGGHIFPGFHHWLHDRIAPEHLRWLSAILTTAVMFGPGWRFHRAGLPGLMARRPDMNALVSLGTLAAWGYSLIVTLVPTAFPEAHRVVYFESAAVIITLILLGRWLEARSRGEAGRAIERLVALQPHEARVRRGADFVGVPVSAIEAGEEVELLPGDRVPVDGIVIEGRSHLDEAMLTGEPMPVEKGPGIGLTGGTVNLEGRLVMRATRVGRDATLQRIIRLVESAQSGKLPIQSRIDQITAVFVPFILGIALATFVAWLVLAPEQGVPAALVHAVSVLIIACPCAMGLATPMSILVGTGRAAELGILFRDGTALQRLAGVRRIAFDKTGTLTRGKPVLTDFVTAPGETREQVLAELSAVEAQSEHPIARAVMAFATSEGILVPKAEAVRAEVGQGLSGAIGGKRVLVGAARFMLAEGIDVAPLAAAAAVLAEAGKGAIYVARNGIVTGLFAISDPERDDARSALEALTRLGFSTAVISGDAAAPTRALAARLGIGQVVSEATPQRKRDEIARWQAAGETVAFVGDGINDAAALGGADIGIAIGSGTEIAIESADLVLVSGRLQALVDAIGLARATLRNISQNLFWAFGYNIVLVPLAAGVFYPFFGIALSPAFAALAMALSSVFVVSNALRLRLYTRSAG